MPNVEQYKEKRKPRKSMRGVHDLRTSMKTRIRSKPRVEGQEYLDMYALSRDQARWRRMREQSSDILQEIGEEMHKIAKDSPLIQELMGQEEPNGHPAGGADSPRPTGPMKKVSLDY